MTQADCAQYEYWAIPVSEHCFPELAERSAQVDRNSGFIGWLIETQAPPNRLCYLSNVTIIFAPLSKYPQSIESLSHWTLLGHLLITVKRMNLFPVLYISVFLHQIVFCIELYFGTKSISWLRADISFDAICFRTNCICLVFSLKKN